MRPLKDVAKSNVKTIQQFASRALSKDEITQEAHDRIRADATALLAVVNEAVEANSPVKDREVRTVRQRRRHRNVDVMAQIKQDHREAVR